MKIATKKKRHAISLIANSMLAKVFIFFIASDEQDFDLSQIAKSENLLFFQAAIRKKLAIKFWLFIARNFHREFACHDMQAFFKGRTI